MTYQDKKEIVRQKAIDWQNLLQVKSYSYGEMAIFQNHFEKLGRKYGLLREFRENAIIWIAGLGNF